MSFFSWDYNDINSPWFSAPILNNALLGNIDTDLRQSLHQIKEHAEELEPKVILNDDEIKMYDTMRLNIVQGKDLLKSEIQKYHSLQNRVELMTQKQNVIHNSFEFCKSVIGSLKCDPDETFHGISPKLTQINHLLESLQEDVNKGYNDVLPKTKLDLMKSITIIKKLSDVFTLSSSQYMCPICMTNTIDCIVMDCLHTYCSACAIQIRSTCFVCRKPVSKVNKFYN